MEITAESITVDEESKISAHVGDYEVPSLLQVDESGPLSYEYLATLPPSVKRPLQWHGKYAFLNFCFFAPLMSVGAVVLFLPEAVFPRPSFMKRKRREFDW